MREAHWQGRMEGRLGNTKPVPVVERESLRLRHPNEKTNGEPNPAMQPLPITAKEQELRTAMVTGVRPFLPGAIMMDSELDKTRSESPPARSRSPSPTALDRAFVDERAALDAEMPSGDDRPSSSSSRGGSRGRGRGRGGKKQRAQSSGVGKGAGTGKGKSQNQSQTRSVSPLMGATTLPLISSASHSQIDGIGMGSELLGETVTADLLSSASMTFEPATASAPAQANNQAKKGANRDKGAYLPPAVAPGSELFPVSSQLLRGLKGTIGHRPMVLTLLASKRALWKATAAQQFDPHLHLAAYPPPPDKIVVNLFDVGTISLTAGDKYCPQQSSFVINVREYTGLLYELVERYRQREESERREAMDRRRASQIKYLCRPMRQQCPEPSVLLARVVEHASASRGDGARQG